MLSVNVSGPHWLFFLIYSPSYLLWTASNILTFFLEWRDQPSAYNSRCGFTNALYNESHTCSLLNSILLAINDNMLLDFLITCFTCSITFCRSCIRTPSSHLHQNSVIPCHLENMLFNFVLWQISHFCILCSIASCFNHTLTALYIFIASLFPHHNVFFVSRTDWSTVPLVPLYVVKCWGPSTFTAPWWPEKGHLCPSVFFMPAYCSLGFIICNLDKWLPEI